MKGTTAHANFVAKLDPIGNNRPTITKSDGQIMYEKGIDPIDNPGHEDPKAHPDLVVHDYEQEAVDKSEAENERKDKTENKRKSAAADAAAQDSDDAAGAQKRGAGGAEEGLEELVDLQYD